MNYSTEKNMMLYLTGKQTEADVTVEELEAIAQQYPYFGAARFLLAKKAQAINSPGFEGLAQNAVVHFANPYWFHFRLNEEQLMNDEFALSNEIKPGGPGTEKPALTAEAAYKAVADVTNLLVNRQEANDIAQVKDDIEKEVITPAGDTPQPTDIEAVTGNTDNTPLITPEVEGEVTPQAQETTEDTDYEQLEEEVSKEIEDNEGLEERILSAETESEHEEDEVVPAVSLEDVPLDKDDVVPAVLPEDVPLDKDDVVPAVSLEDVPLDKDDIVPAVLPEDVPLDKDDIVPAIDVDSEDITEEANTIPAAETVNDAVENGDIVPAVEQVEEAPAEIDEAQAIVEDEHPEGLPLHIPGTGEDYDASGAEDDGELADADGEYGDIGGSGPVSDKISAVLQDQLEEFKKPVAADTQVPIETEPYHTVDYFASQGIKLSLDQQKHDNLGVKVRKFTDWLKQMKRVSPTPADLGIDEAAEHKVQSIAATSNEVKEVVTEAMAEVLAMQGMNDKAIQVYKKLSFLEPTKSAYFAAKIDNLKG